MWYLPGLGTEPVCPALASGFLATRPQGKSCTTFSLSIPLLMDVAIRSLLFGSWAIVCQPLVLTHGFLFSLMDLLGLILHYHYIFDAQDCFILGQWEPLHLTSCVPLPHCSLRAFWLPHTRMARGSSAFPLELSHFSKEPWLLSSEKNIWKPWSTCTHCYWGFILVGPSQRTDLGNRYVYACTSTLLVTYIN